METTEPLNVGTIQGVADSLLNVPENQPEVTEAVTEVTQEEPEVIEAEAEEVDVVEASDDEENTGDEDIEELEQTTEPEPLYTVKMDGEELEVNLEELKRGYSGQKYIQKGMAEVADAKKQVSASKAELEQAQSQLEEERQVLINIFQQTQNGAPQVLPYPSEELKTSDPIRWQQEAEDYRRSLEKKQQWDIQQNYVLKGQREAQAKAEQEYDQQQTQLLIEWLPELADVEKRKSIYKNVKEQAKEHYSLTEEDLKTVRSAQEFVILNDALKWRKFQKEKPEIKKKAEGSRPVVKAAAKQSQQAGNAKKSKQSFDKMKKTGSHSDVATWLLTS